ncbi:MAG: DHA2 family efflux MFS transporter permease subunit [Candidatus Omnitrophota bacterium]
MSQAPAAAAWKPRHHPWLIALSVMMATVLEVLDTSVANVALPHIAGNLSATNHESTWVLTSYLVSNAIILPAAAWFGGFFGRKRFLIVCIIIFTVSSVLCGLANSLGFLIFARVLQGLGGGALQPISQAVLLESFPREKRGQAMAVFSMGVVVAPIIGPIVGGWITDNWSWRWVFLINLPLGILAAFMVRAFVEDPPYIRQVRSRIDYIGFSLMAVGLGTLQLILDKGQEVDWFHAPWLCWCSGLVAVALVGFIIWELRVKNPVVNLKIFCDRNFALGTLAIGAVGAVLYGTLALLPLFFQTMMGYSAYQGGLAIGPRGIGAFLAAIVVGRLSGKVSNRLFLGVGFFILGWTCFLMGNINLQMSITSVLWAVIGNGTALPMVFIALTTLSMSTLRNEDIGNAAGLFNLTRNIGGAIGIAVATTLLARMEQVHRVSMVAHLTPYDPAYQAAVAQAGMGHVYRELSRQAVLMAFIDNFLWFGILSLCFIPLAFLFRSGASSRAAGGMSGH